MTKKKVKKKEHDELIEKLNEEFDRYVDVTTHAHVCPDCLGPVYDDWCIKCEKVVAPPSKS